MIAVKTGYSLALGAFLLGAIVAETPQRPTVERAMQGMRDVFIAVFFVSIGMLLNPALLLKNWVLILSLGMLAILVRTFALSASLLVTGTSDRDAFRAALMVTPIGEFAFIIAQLGVSGGLLSVRLLPDRSRRRAVHRPRFSVFDPAFRPDQRRVAESAAEVLL